MILQSLVPSSQWVVLLAYYWIHFRASGRPKIYHLVTSPGSYPKKQRLVLGKWPHKGENRSALLQVTSHSLGWAVVQRWRPMFQENLKLRNVTGEPRFPNPGFQRKDFPWTPPDLCTPLLPLAMRSWVFDTYQHIVSLTKPTSLCHLLVLGFACQGRTHFPVPLRALPFWLWAGAVGRDGVSLPNSRVHF